MMKLQFRISQFLENARFIYFDVNFSFLFYICISSSNNLLKFLITKQMAYNINMDMRIFTNKHNYICFMQYFVYSGVCKRLKLEIFNTFAVIVYLFFVVVNWIFEIFHSVQLKLRILCWTTFMLICFYKYDSFFQFICDKVHS